MRGDSGAFLWGCLAGEDDDNSQCNGSGWWGGDAFDQEERRVVVFRPFSILWHRRRVGVELKKAGLFKKEHGLGFKFCSHKSYGINDGLKQISYSDSGDLKYSNKA